MSTSDAGELEPSAVGGRATPLYGTARQGPTAPAREHQDETFAKRFKQKNRDDDEAPADHNCHQSAIRQEKTHKALTSSADGRGKDEASHCRDSRPQIWRSDEPRFTSSLFFRLSSNLSLDKPELRHKKILDSCQQSLIEPQWIETKDSSSEINDRTSPYGSIKKTNVYSLSETIPFPAQKEEEVITVVCDEQEITGDLSITRILSNGDVGPRERNSSHALPWGSQPGTCTDSLSGVEIEDDTAHRTKLESQADPSVNMLSSTVVTVLAPHWSGRIRRPKKTDGAGSSEDAAAGRAHGFQGSAQHGMGSMLTHELQGQMRAPALGHRSNTVGWSTKSDPSSFDYNSKRKMTQTVSLDVNAASSVSPFLRNPNEQRSNSQTGDQGQLASLSSKPTTSTLLLSLRKLNTSGRNSNATSAFSDVNTSPLSPSDQNGKLFTTHLSQGFANNNEQERPKPLLSPSSLSYRTPESGPVLSPSPSNQRERPKSDTLFFPTSPVGRAAEEVPFTQQPQAINRAQSGLTSSKQAFLHKGPSEKQQNHMGSDKSANLMSDTSLSLSRHSTFDRLSQQKTHAVPRTTLTSTSWWKQVTQEGSSSLTRSDTKNIKDKANTPLIPPCHDNRDTVPSSLTDNKRLSSQIPNNRNNNNTRESLFKGNLNLFMKIQGGAPDLRQRNAENSQDSESNRLVKQPYGSNSNSREPQKPHSVPDVLSSSKISRTQTTLSHLKNPSKHDASTYFTANITEPPTLLNPKSPNTPTESSSKYQNNYCPPKSNNTPISHMDTHRFTRPSLSPDFTTTTRNSQALNSQTTSGLSPDPNTKSSFFLRSHPVSSQTSIHTSSYTSPSSQTPRVTDLANATPIGFERCYASLAKSSQPKTVPAVSSFSKTNSPVSTISAASSSTNDGHPAATSSSLLKPPASTSSPTSVTSLLTLPATPVITSPNSGTSSPKGGRTFSNSLERDSTKLRPGVDGKRARRVTWDESVDMQCSEPATVEKPDPSQVPTNPLPSSMSPRSVSSIFSFLRSGSPTTSTSPLHTSTSTPSTSNIQVGRGGKYRSLSSDSADLASREREKNRQGAGDTVTFDQRRQGLTTPRQERTLSVESGTVQCRSYAPLSLPPDFSRGYKVRYSTPPYSTLMSSRHAQGETKTITPRAPLFSQPPQFHYTLQHSLNTGIIAARALATARPPLSPPKTVQPLSLPLPLQKQTPTIDSTACVVSETDQINNNHSKNSSQPAQNRQLLLVNNRVQFSSQSLPGDKAVNSSSTCVTETLVYSIASKVDTATAAPKSTAPKPSQHTANTPVSMETKLSQQSHTVQSKEAAGEACSHSDLSSSGSSSTESQSREGESSSSSRRRMKESVLGKSRFFSMEADNEQSPKRSRFALKKSVSTPNASLSRSESERANKSGNRMDQVLNKLKQKFSTKRSDDDPSFPWKWKRTSQTPSVSGSSDISDISVDGAKTVEVRGQEKGMVQNNNKMDTEDTDRWTQHKYTLVPSSAVGRTDQFSSWSEKSTPDTNPDPDELNTHADTSDNKGQVLLRVHSPTLLPQLELYEDTGTDYKAADHLLSCRDPSPCRSPNPSGAYSTQYRRSTPSPRSPFSPFASLSPLSPFSSSEVTDDSVFYSPKLQRRRDTSSPCEPAEGISLGVTRRSRASTGPPSIGPIQDNERLASSYADLKYGIEPGRSFSVSSVLSSRPSGPGRISTGSRFMSVGDLSQSALSCGGRDMDQWSVTPNWTTELDGQPTNDCQMYFPSDPGKMRSRSLPRSLTRCLANWSSEASPPQPVSTTASKPARVQSPNICHFSWDTEGPPTPPPTPPLSPVSRRMSKPPSLSSPTFPSPPGALQQVDSQSSRGHLPSRGYMSSLSTFEESSDSSSDTTTDDEYYLETDGDGEKETEL